MKYKLIKCYPGSPNIGDTAIFRENYSDYTISNTFHQPLPKNIIELNPEFWQKIKESLFITEDGIVLYNEDDKVFGVLPKANWQVNYYNGNGIPLSVLLPKTITAWKFFSTKKTAEEYIHYNKPLYSRKDVKELLNFVSTNAVKYWPNYVHNIFGI